MGGATTLRAADVGLFLLERGLIGAADVVDGGFRLEDMSGRHQVFLATAGGRAFAVKTGPEREWIARETAVLECLHAARFPAAVPFWRADGAIVLEAPAGAQDLNRRGPPSARVARAAGRALAALHALPGDLLDGVTAADPRRLLRLHRPDRRRLESLSAAGVELVRVVQASPQLCAGLDDLLAHWTDDTIVHADIRWDNVLAARARIMLVDWEQAARGEPALDVGAFLGEFLRTWVQSIPIVDPDDPGRLLARAGRPLSRIRPAAQAFWDGYDRAAPLARVLRFAAARLLAAAFEHAQNRYELDGTARYLTQMAANVFDYPDVAAAQLLGLRP